MRLGQTKLQLSHQPLIVEKSKFSSWVISPPFLNFFSSKFCSHLNILTNRYFHSWKWRILGVANRETSCGGILSPDWVGTRLSKTRICSKNEQRAKMLLIVTNSLLEWNSSCPSFWWHEEPSFTQVPKTSGRGYVSHSKNHFLKFWP